MTYPPPGGENPQYQLQPEPQQPSDPYMQGYNSTPPPPGNYYQPQPGYPPQPPPGQPNYTQPPIGVQPGYPTAPGSVLPPPIPPAKQGNNLGIILGVIVAIVVVLGVAAVLIIPGLTGDDEDPSAGGDPTTSEKASEAETSAAEEPTEEETDGGDQPAAGGFDTWGTPSSESDYDAASPEGVAIAYQVAQNAGDDATLESLVSSSATDDMTWDLQYELDDTTAPNDWPFWGMSRTLDDGTVQAWAGYTWDDTAPVAADDIVGGYTYTLVEEGGTWKLYDLVYGLAE